MGDAKFAGTAIEVTDPDIKRAYVAAAGTAPPGDYHLYRTDITEVVVIRARRSAATTSSSADGRPSEA